MSKNDEAVDVLAVLDAQARHTRQFGGSPSFQTIEEARAAVAELIAADRKFDAAFNAWMVDRTNPAALDALTEATDVRAAALARIGGAA
jgi:hypothetical protein